MDDLEDLTDEEFWRVDKVRRTMLYRLIGQTFWKWDGKKVGRPPSPRLRLSNMFKSSKARKKRSAA